jgi:AcrR family transcriptional regulator
VREALIEAAADLFAERGDASVRSIARRAGVNHGLIHHYFGGKAGLRAAVLARLSEQQAAALTQPGALEDTARLARKVAGDDPRNLKILARALLDGELPPELQASFPVVERLIAAAGEAGVAEPRALVAEGLAMALGEFVFGPWIRAATGLDEAALEAGLERAMLRSLREALE